MPLPWRVKVYNGSSFVDAELKTWNGSAWVTTNGYFWNGTSWVLMTDRSPDTQIYTLQYSPIWAGSYQGNNSLRNDTNGNTYNYQGDAGNSWGIQRCMWGYGTQPNDDAQGTVSEIGCRVLFSNVHTWYNDGTQAIIGTHGVSGGSRPSSYSENNFDLHNYHYSRGETVWAPITTNYIGALENNTIFGFTMRAPDSDLRYYSYWTKDPTFEMTIEK